MNKVLSIIFFWALFLSSFQNSSNIFASTSKLKIEQIQINEHDVSWPDWQQFYGINYERLGPDGLPINLELTNGAESISFRFNKSENNEIKYRYKLQGKDTTWKYSHNSEWAKFYKVKEGEYCFLLQEIEKNKVTQEVKFNFYNKLNEFWIKNDIINLLISLVCIWGIIKMK